MSNLCRLAIGVEYDGTNYNGWQFQPHAPSVQERLNQAISSVANETVQCIGSGRTDSGVHASGQVVHYDSTASRTQREWLLGINTHLPDDINVLWVKAVEDKFHARYSAIRRGYLYSILNRPMRSALARHRAWWFRQPLNEQDMSEAAASLIGSHDFSSFRAAGCQAHSPVRNMLKMQIWRQHDWVFIACEANAFLHHMVRNIAGTLVEIGQGDRPVGWMSELLKARDRKLAGITAPAAGLELTRIEYPAEFGLQNPFAENT